MIEHAVNFPERQPFSLDDPAAYADWRAWKLAHFTVDAAELTVEIADPLALQPAEKAAILRLAGRNNMVVYRFEEHDRPAKELVRRFGEQLGLCRLDDNLRADEDSITSLEVRAQEGNQYIPYTSRPLSWHTDGYYNRLDRQIRGIILHCVAPARAGGVSGMVDHEQVYMRLRDEDPALVAALMHPRAMTIPANIENGEEIRPAQSGPVFSVEPVSGRLHMRYSARQRNIEWREDSATQAAASRITCLLREDSLVCRTRLGAGEGVVCNNVLHNRSGFEDSAAHKRLMLRARYYDYIH